MSPHKTKGYRVTKRERNEYRMEAWPMLLLAFGLVNGGLGALFKSEEAKSTSVAQILEGSAHIFEVMWIVAYVAGGVMIFWGVLRPWPVLEVLGEWLAAWALLVNLLALIILRGIPATGTSMGAFLVAISVCLVRIHRLHVRAQHDRRRIAEPYDGPDRRVA